jgi:hypothetical protein
MQNSHSDAFADPAQVVRRFITDMHQWESQTLSAYEMAKKSEQYEAFWDMGREALGKVFSRWCTPKERKYGRLGSFSDPPEYQPEHEAILETILESSRRASVHTQRTTGFGHKRKYVLLKKGDRWLIDSVKWQTHDGKWSNGIL